MNIVGSQLSNAVAFSGTFILFQAFERTLTEFSLLHEVVVFGRLICCK